MQTGRFLATLAERECQTNGLDTLTVAPLALADLRIVTIYAYFLWKTIKRTL